MTSDVFRRVGRGGAGNWYSKKDVEDADKQDLEAQAAPGNAVLPDHSDAAPVAYARGGRGGAGNFHDGATMPSPAAERQASAHLHAAVDAAAAANAAATVAAAASPRPYRSSGRGGAGNWSAAAEREQGGAAEEQRRKQAALEAQILRNVEAGLAMPAPAYHGAPPSKGKRGSA